MKERKRKIGFYSIKLYKNRSDTVINPEPIKKTLGYVDGLSEEKRLVDRSSSSKVHLYRKGKLKGRIHKLLFGSAKYNYRPPLINKTTGARRLSPKKLDEGEEEKTHIVMKYLNDEIVVVIEERKSGLAIGSFVQYLGVMEQRRCKDAKEKKKFRLDYTVIPKENFLDELKALDRVVSAEIHTSKSLLGSSCMNF